MRLPSICVIIVNWNRPGDTVDAIESVLSANGKISLKVILIDNGSTDNSVDVFEKRYSNDKRVYLIKTQKNLGFAEGNNVGIKYALSKNYDFVMLLNNDAVVDKNIFFAFVKAAKNFPESGIFSPKIYFANGFEFHRDKYKEKDRGKVIWSAGGVIDWDNVYANNRGLDEVDHGQFALARRVDWATGACMFITSEALNKTGGFDKKYFMYFEDVDLSFKARKLGFDIMFIPEAIVWHKVAQSSGIGSGLNDYFLTRNRLYFGIKHASFKTKLALIRESFRVLQAGRVWQKRGARDCYLLRFGKGSWK